MEALLATLRRRQSFSLEEINASLGPGLDELNVRQMEHLGKGRRKLYNSSTGQLCDRSLGAFRDDGAEPGPD